MASDDVLALALHMNRAGFAARFADAILVGDGAIIKSTSPATMTMAAVLAPDEITSITRASSDPLPTAFIFAVRKMKYGSTDPIAVGRSPGNDIVIGDISVSKVHAHFHKIAGEPMSITDAGSMNGTWVADDRLVPGAEPFPVTPGTRLRFGNVALTLVDAGAFWDRIRTPSSFET